MSRERGQERGGRLEKFFNLRAEKQEHIIDAAFTIFGKNGYKKASIADIAEQAGIAKGMVLYYFGSKKNLYLYLAELCKKVIMEEMEKGADESVTDFFDRIKMMTDTKIAAMKRYPAVFSFVTSIYYETDEEVREDVQKFMEDSISIRESWVFSKTDTSKFKDDIDPRLIEKFLVWAGEGFASSLPFNGDMHQLNAFTEEFYQCLNVMKKYFYKEEEKNEL